MGGVLYEEGITLPGAVTVAEAAAWLGVSTKWIFRRVRDGRLHVVGREGRCLLVASSPSSTRAWSASPMPVPYSADRRGMVTSVTTVEVLGSQWPGDLCRIVCSGSDSAIVTVVGARAVRVLASVVPTDRQVVDGDGWRVPVGVVPLLRASMRLRGVSVEVLA